MGILQTLQMSIITIICIWIFILGLLSLHFSDKNDSCSMTYMFEYPQFVRISVHDSDQPSQYGLYAYSEGRFTERARKMWFDGVPVLFLPGNSGSHMQARSLASVALRKAISSGTNFHFDFFTISFNEEISALYGGVLDRQADFAAASIYRILSLYHDNKYTKTVPTSVILIGHSMGGVIAKRLLSRHDTIYATKIAIALASPLVAPVINFDLKMNSFYLTMDAEWNENIRKDEHRKSNKMLLSIAGGYSDVLVPSGLTLDNDSYVNAATTAIPGVWVSPDHVSIVWCKQVVMAINRFLFSIVDRDTQQVNENMELIKSKANMYFKSNRSMIMNPRTAHANANMTADAFWYEDNRRLYQISRPEIDKMTYLMIRLISFPVNRFVAIEAINVSDSDWVYGCSAHEVTSTYRYCSEATPLTELSRWTGAAPSYGKRKLATIHLHSLMQRFRDWTHVVVKVSPTRKPVILNVDINDLDSRQKVFHIGWTLLGRTDVIPRTEPGSLYYEIILPLISEVQQTYYLYIEPTSDCKATRYHVSAEMHVPWAENYEYYHYFTHADAPPMKIRLVKSKPLKDYAEKFVKIFVLLDPQCTFSISMSLSWYQRMAQLVRHYIPVLISYIGGLLLLVVARSFEKFSETGTWPSVRAALISLVSSLFDPQVCYGIVTGITILFTYLAHWTPMFVTAGWSNRELHLQFVLSFGVFPTALAAISFLYAASAAAQAIFMFSSQITHRFFFRLVWWGDGSIAEGLASGLQKVPLVVSIGLFFGARLSCGAASLVAGAAFYAFMISKMYEEYLEDFVNNILLKCAGYFIYKFRRSRRQGTGRRPQAVQRRNSNRRQDTAEEAVENTPETIEQANEQLNEQLNNLNFHMMMFLLYVTVATLNVPALITWARNFNDDRVLTFDTSYFMGAVMSICSIYLWQIAGPRKNLNYSVVSHLTNFIALLVLSLGPTSLYLVSQGITVIVLIITGQQLFDRTDEGHFFGWFVLANQMNESLTSPEERPMISQQQTTASEGATAAPERTTAAPEGATAAPQDNETRIGGEKSNLKKKKTEPANKNDLEQKEKVKEKKSTGLLSDEPSTSSAQPADDPGQSNKTEQPEENGLMNKIKKLKEKLSFAENN